jgi:crotonobetainyl-CoA:carnitine CoA-transferase CaiB-like acyl-CoA transferase
MDRQEPDMKPLQGLRILSFEQFAAGPYGSMFLADMGAEVIKIENKNIGGDPSRRTGPYLLGSEDSLYFQGWNTNKGSITLDIKDPQDRIAFEQLVSSADAVVNNLRGDLPASLELDYASLKHIKPDLVCLHISAYGRDNERAAWPGYDFLMQAEAGLMDLTGDPDGPPARFGASVIDYMTGITGMLGMLGALRHAKESGQGCDVDTCLFDVALHQLGYAATWYLNEGLLSGRQARSAHLSVAPVQTYPTADGWIYIMCMTDKFWQSLLRALGRNDLIVDPRFATQAARVQHRDALTAVLDLEFRRASTAHWLATLSGVLPIAPVFDLEHALDSPFVDRIGMVSTVPHPLKPDMKILSSPLKFDGVRPTQVMCHALGADNALLREPATNGANIVGLVP